MTVKELRKACGMTQQVFADYFEMSKRNVENWESGKISPPEWVLKLIEYKLHSEGLI